MAGPQQRNPLTCVSSNIPILPRPCPSRKSVLPSKNQNQASLRPSCPYDYPYDNEKSRDPSNSTQAQSAGSMEHKTCSTHFTATSSTNRGHPWTSQPYYTGWTRSGYTKYPQGYHWPTQPYPVPRKQTDNTQPIVPMLTTDNTSSVVPKSCPRSFLPYKALRDGLNENKIQSIFETCMEVCNKEKNIKAFEDLLKFGANNLKHGWLKTVFVQGDITTNKILKHFLWSIVLTFDQQVSIGMRGKLVHAWGTTLETLRNWRNRMKVATNSLTTIAKHQIDFRGHKSNPLLMYTAAREMQKLQERIAELGTKGKQPVDKMGLERALQLNKEKVATQERCIGALQGREMSLEEDNKQLSNSLKHWKSCFSKLVEENENLKMLASKITVENTAEV